MIKDYEDNIKIFLEQFGFPQSEIEVFLIGLKNWPSTIIELSKLSKLQRITTHAIVERLIEKGLFLQSYAKNKRLVYANDLSSIEQLIEQKKHALRELELSYEKTKPLLESIKSRSENFPKVRFYKGKEGIEIMLHEMVSDKKDLYILSDAQHFYDLIDNNFLEKSIEVRKAYNLKTKMIFPAGFEHFCYTQGTYNQNLEIRSLPNEKLLKWGMNSRGNKVAYHCYQQGFITTTIIEDEAFCNIMHFLFESVWNNATGY